ncbi:ABC transporter ATP-binding protein [Ensifer sp. YR511]|uniref:ABC transporter ATP-binding protein n=1 Tax=Ensifer sp. YR511 TaxID=1855294 RepID=UPI0008882AEA|nr:ABC transporter ATP-binding protein [Ensifer sp. YR511]SDN75928.1 iron(III) transport system ATP-binding protein [Ensifer sp. YR511]
MVKLIVENLVKAFGSFVGVDNVSFEVQDGEFLTLLGPSGCGKSTTLAAIAGLDRPTSGRIVAGNVTFFDGARNEYLVTERRNCGLVFQSYALWPHMTVAKNVAFPLELRKVPKAEITRRVDDVLKLVELSKLGDRYPHQLSGGQQQRVALARTLVYRPSILLLDEPLSNLDAKLRERARGWLREIQERVRITTIYVTHDQAEALALSDRIAVMSSGRIAQLGTPREIYNQPSNPTVAEFIGTTSFLDGTAVGQAPAHGDMFVRLSSGEIITAPSNRKLSRGAPVRIALRPERLDLLKEDTAMDETGAKINVKIEGATYLGNTIQYEVSLGDDRRIKVETQRDLMADRALLWIPSRACSLFEVDGSAPVPTRIRLP